MAEVNSSYDFILNPAKNQPLAGGGGKRTKILLMIIVVVVLAIGAVLAYSFISGRGKASNKSLITIAQKQTEIIRIAGIGKQKATSPDTKALAAIIESSVTSSEVQFANLIKAKGGKTTPQILTEAKDPFADTKLNSASVNNTFDDTFKEVITAKLEDYQLALKTLFDQTTANNEKQFIVNASNQVAVILNKK